MRKVKALLLVFLSISALFIVSQPSLYVSAETVTYQVSADLDDQFIDELDGLISHIDTQGGESVLFVGLGYTAEMEQLAAGKHLILRFTNINIPQGAKIVSAYIELHVAVYGSSMGGGTLYLDIYGEDTGNAAQITDVTDFQNRARTTNYVRWTIEDPSSLSDVWLQSPDISPVIQEIVDRSDWASGNAIQLLIDISDEDGGYIDSGFDMHDYTHDPTLAAKLVIEYSLGSPDVQLSASTTSQNADPSTSVTFTVTLTNNGTADGSYSISASDTNNWNITLSQTSASLSAGESTDITVTVEVPFVEAGTTDTITVTATESSTGISRSIQLSVTVNAYLSFDIEGAFSWLEFDGSSSYVYLDDPDTHTSAYFDAAFSQRTVFVEFYAYDVTTTQCIYEEGGGANGMNIYISNGYIYAGAWVESNNWNGAWINATITAGEWHKAMLIFDYSGTGTMSFYLDGNLVGSVSVPVQMASHGDDDFIGMVKASSKFHTGDVSASSGGYFFNGRIKYFIVWDAALTDTERSQVFSDPSNPPATNLILNYAPDSLKAFVWVDKSGTGNDGTITAATPHFDLSGASGNSVSFGVTVTVTSNANFDVNVYGTDFSDGNGHSIPISSIYADKDGNSPYDLTLSTTAQTLYSNYAWGQNVQLPVYFIVSIPAGLPEGTYTGTLYIDVTHV